MGGGRGWGRWGAIAAAGGLGVLLVLGAGWLWLRSSVPAYDGTVAVGGSGTGGLEAPVRVVRDAHAIPRIQARSMGDAYFALGYVHAQDRLWQMEMARRLGHGRLAEVLPAFLGSWPLRSDRSMRALGLSRLAESSLEALAPEVRRALEAYASGVNAFLATRRGAWPPEFVALGFRPAPWRPVDTLVLGKLQALQLSGNFRDELLRARLLARLTAAEVADLFPPETASAPPTVTGEGRQSQQGPGVPAGGSGDGQIEAFAGLFDRVSTSLPPPLGPSVASNEWVVAGGQSDTGKPVLANDPHLGLSAPVLWYLARIETPELTLAGATLPGVPFHILGHNGRVAWGMATTASDTQDVFVEKLAPGDSGYYLTPEGVAPFETRRELIAVRGAPDQVMMVRATRHGPVLPEDSPLAPTKAAEGHVLALAFTGLGARDTTAEAFYRLNRARDVEAFTAALQFHQTPQYNVVYADTGGTIGFYAPGLVPVRARGKGLVPVPGWSGAFDWTGVVPFEALPHALNPPSGRLVNANNAAVGPDYPWLLAAEWPDSFRARRIHTLMDQRRRVSVAGSVTMQLDIQSLPAQTLLPLMLPRPGAETAARSRTAQAALALLRRWDGSMARDTPEPLIFSWWLREFHRSLFAERLGPLFSEYWSLRPQVIQHILTEAPTWCDRPDAPRTRTCSDLLWTSLEITMQTLAGRYGDDPSRWRWGAEHRAPFDHPLISRVPGLRWLMGFGIETDGDSFTLNRGGSRIENEDAPFADIHGPGLRAVYDLADLNQSLFMIATGQSGNPLSPHYHDLVGSWRDGAGLLLASVPSGGVLGTLVLQPPDGK